MTVRQFDPVAGVPRRMFIIVLEPGESSDNKAFRLVTKVDRTLSTCRFLPDVNRLRMRIGGGCGPLSTRANARIVLWAIRRVVGQAKGRKL